MRAHEQQERTRGGALTSCGLSIGPFVTVLFLMYDGMCDHIAQSQVAPYLLGLAERGWSITIVSLEKRDVPEAKRAAVADRLKRARIEWLPQPYFHASGL